MTTPSIEKRPAPFRGSTSSSDFNAFQDETIKALVDQGLLVESLRSEMDMTKQVLYAEMEDLRARLSMLDQQQSFDDLMLARSGAVITTVQDFRELETITYGSLAAGKRMRVDPRYGQCLLPYNRVVHRFFTPNLDVNGITQTSGIELTVTSVDETDVSGADALIDAGTPKYAVNGHNQDYWIRQVRLPLESDKTAVNCRLLIKVPDSYVNLSNVLTIHPYPLGAVDIVGVWYSTGTAAPDPTDSSQLLPGFPTSGVDNASHYRIHFDPLAITQILIEFRQRTWKEREGKKLFEYGAQEVSLQLIEFDQNTSAAHNANVTAANGVVSKFSAPTGYYFDEVRGFFASPTYPTTGSPSTPEIFHRLFTDSALTNEIWNSYTDQLPQDLSVSVGITNTDTLYLLTTANYDTTGSVSPVLEYMGLQYTVRT